jgi:hypothetical protein
MPQPEGRKYPLSNSRGQPFCFALTFAQRRLCAATIFALLFADILRRLRIGLPPAIHTSKRRKRRIQTSQLTVTFFSQLLHYD